MSLKDRFIEVDVAKVAGIAAVILIHSMRAPWNPNVAPAEVWLGHVTRFAVPGFLAASGLLYATRHAVPGELTRARLRRVLVPYLVASLCAQLYWVGVGEPKGGAEIAKDLLLASSFGPFYYVLLIGGLVLLTPLLAKLSRVAHSRLFAAALAGQLLFELWHPLGVYWHLRNPLLWLAYFHAGWLIGLHREAIAAAVAHRRSWLGPSAAGSVLVLAGLLALELPNAATGLLAWLLIWASLASVYVLACGRPAPHPAIRSFSDATYAMYLFHLLFVKPIRLALPSPPGALDAVPVLAPWLAGVAGSLAIVFAARALLGSRARTWVGA